ncbi:MAG: ABC transporter permease, partial [Vicinamibacterales bacterium]
MQRLRYLVWKEFLELRMNPRLFGVVIVAPIIQLTMLGYAATTDVRDVPVVVADGDRTARSRELVARFEGSPNFSVVSTVTTVAEIEPFLERNRAWLALAIPAGYGSTIASGRSAVLQVVADGTDSNSTTVALGYATSLIGGYGQELAAERATAGSIPAPAIDARIRVWFNPQLESRFFMLPGVLALMLLVVTANLASMAVVREKELGTLEQLNVTPLRRWELIAGKLLPYGVIAMVDVVLAVAVAVGWFEVPLRGSFLLLFAMCAIYVFSTLALGLFISTISDTQQQAMMTST